MKRPVCFRLAPIMGVACAILACGCGGSGHYVWIHDLPPHASVNPDFVIQDGDGLDIRVFSQEAMSTHARVRNDGRIATPVLGDIEVRGKRPSDVKSELEAQASRATSNTPSVGHRGGIPAIRCSGPRRGSASGSDCPRSLRDVGGESDRARRWPHRTMRRAANCS